MYVTSMEHLTGVLRRQREAAGYSLRSLYDRTGISPSTLHRWESPAPGNPLGAPPVEYVARLADALGLGAIDRSLLLDAAVKSAIIRGLSDER